MIYLISFLLLGISVVSNFFTIYNCCMVNLQEQCLVTFLRQSEKKNQGKYLGASANYWLRCPDTVFEALYGDEGNVL